MASSGSRGKGSAAVVIALFDLVRRLRRRSDARGGRLYVRQIATHFREDARDFCCPAFVLPARSIFWPSNPTPFL